MSFEIKRKESVPDGVRRVSRERVAKVLDDLHGKRPAHDEDVHDARKKLKQVRGALRLVKGEFSGRQFDRDNYAFRDAGRPLSEVRDAKVLVDTLDELARRHKGELASGAFKRLRSALEVRRRDVRKRILSKTPATRDISREMRKSLKRISNWPLQHPGWKGLVDGLRQSYSKGRQAMNQALNDGGDGAYHEWRKRSKDLRYGIELLARAWPEAMQPLADQTHHLTDLLGQDHDLAVLQELVENELKDAAADSERELLKAMIVQRREELQKEACELGRKLYAETPGEFVGRIHQYWTEWRS